MGHYHIISVSEDVIHLNRGREEELASSIGRAIVSLCDDPLQFAVTGSGTPRIEWRDVLNRSAAITRVGSVDYNDTQLFVWSRAGLKTLRDLSEEELHDVASMASAEIARRAQR